MLYRLMHRDTFDRIALMAAPSLLGALRDKLHLEVRDKVFWEVPNGLTNTPVDEIERIEMGALEGA